MNVLHHFAFGDTKSGDYNFKLNPSETKTAPSNLITPNTNSHDIKKFKNIDDTGSLSCHFLDINSGFRDLLLENKKLVNLQNQEAELTDLGPGSLETSGVIVEEMCNCEKEHCQAFPTGHGSNQRRGSSSSLLHLSLSIGKSAVPAKPPQTTEYKLKQELLNDVSNYFEEEDEDEQIKRKENLLQELLKIEKQLDLQKRQAVGGHAKTGSPTHKTRAQEELNNSNNYDHISMINKYLIKKCQYDLNRLYKIKLKQLQQKPIEFGKSEPEKQAVKTLGQQKVPTSMLNVSLVVKKFS